MARNHALEILPIRLGDLARPGIICKHDASTLVVLGDQSSRASCAFLLRLGMACESLLMMQYDLWRTCYIASAGHAFNTPHLGSRHKCLPFYK